MSEKKTDLTALRKDYMRGELDESHVNPDPILQFQKWMEEALFVDVPEPYAMCLATADSQGQPSARIVLLRGVDSRGFVFFTNYGSHKGQELLENPKAALTFYWAELERQIRIEGAVIKTTPEESDQYFLSRPKENRIGAWASPQSQVIDNRDWLELQVDTVRGQFEGKEVHRPENWGGYRLDPNLIEFWQGRPSRLHDRIQFKKNGDSWTIDRLAP